MKIENINKINMLNLIKESLMKSFKTFLGMLLALITLTVVTNAATLVVDPVNGPYTTIQSAVNAANGGDIIDIVAGTYPENVIITGAKNGITIQGAGSTTILDGTGLANPRIAFKIQADNVTIKNLKIQDYVYTSTENVSYGSVTRGAGIVADLATSLHTFTNVEITNCNFGIYVREGNSISITNTNITDINATTNATVENRGGIGIAFEANGINMDNNIIRNNTINDANRYGIWYGRTTGDVGSDMTFIENNYILNIGTGYAGDGIGLVLNRIKQNDVILVSDNHFGFDGTIYAPSDIHLFINSQASGENLDVTVIDNVFYATATSVELYTTDFFGGDFLYDIWLNNGNRYTDVAYIYPGTAAALEANTNVVVENNGYRYIRNVVNNAVDDAEWYRTMGGGTYSKVFVTNGSFPNTAITVDEDDIYLLAESNNVVLVTDGVNPIISFNNSDRISSTWASVDGFTFQFTVVAGTYNGININSGSSDLLIQNNEFESTANIGIYYNGISIFDGADNITIKNNSFSNLVDNGVRIENDNSVATVIECNLFSAGASSNAAVLIDDINAGGDISNVIVRQNTVSTFFTYGVYIDNNGAGTVSDITVGGMDNTNTFKAGNIFQNTGVGVIVMENGSGIVINYNAFGIDNGTAIDNSSAVPVNAHFNYFEGVNSDFTTNIPARNSHSFPEIEWLPVYSSVNDIATDDQSTECGFQPNVENLWVPVYTATAEGNYIDAVGNEFFLTIKEAVADGNTGFASTNPYVYLSNGTFVEDGDFLPIMLNTPMHIGIAPAQPANLATAGNVIISSDNDAVFYVMAGGTGVAGQEMKIDGLTFNTTGDYNLIFVDGGLNNIVFTGNNFDFTGSTANTKSAIFIGDNNITRDNYLFYNNTFTLTSSNTGIDYGSDMLNVSSNIYLLHNTFEFTPTNLSTDISVRLGSVSGTLDVLGNSFIGGGLYLGKDGSDYTDVQIGAAGNHPTYGFLQGNTFQYQNTALVYGIRIVNNGGVGVIANAGTFNIAQNIFDYTDFAISIDNSIVDGDINLDNIFINENNFSFDNFNSVIDVAIASTENIDATNNYWNHAKGPYALAAPPMWHDEFPNMPTTIISNSYGYPEVMNENAALLNDIENNVIFTPFWTVEPVGNPGEYTGTSFAPITNNDIVAGYFSSLTFAVDGTTTGGTIIIKDGTYTEQNTIENDGKDLYITTESQVFPTNVNIQSDMNNVDDLLIADPADILFEVTSGNVDFEFLHFANLNGDISAGVCNSGNGDVEVNYCSATGMDDGTNDWGDGFTNISIGSLTIMNSTMTGNLYGASALAGSLYVNSCTITSNGVQTLSGLYVETYDEFIASNNTIYNCIQGIELYEPNLGHSTIVTLNDIYNNDYGFTIGQSSPTEDFSSAVITNNAIYDNNTAGLFYDADNLSKVLNVENNYWGSSNGPDSDGSGATPYNAYNVASQGNAVFSPNATSFVDYLPWRNYLSSVTISKTAGPRFAPIVLTNSANVAYSDGYYANFTTANNASIPNDNVYVYNGTYTENWTLTANTVNFIGKTSAAYLATWLYTPNAATFTNTYSTATKGAGAGAPVLTSTNATLLGLGAGASNNTFTGFVFDLGVNAITQSAVQLVGASPNANTFTYITFNNLDVDDIAFDLIGFDMDGITIQHNDFNGVAGGLSIWLKAVSDGNLNLINASYNDIYGSYSYFQNVVGNLTNTTLSYNEFNQVQFGVLLEADGMPGAIIDFDINNNLFKDGDGTIPQSAFFITNTSINGAVDWTSIRFTNNRMDYTGAGGWNNPIVGFQTGFTPDFNIVATCNWWNDTNNEGPTNGFNPNGNGLTVSNNADFTPWLGVNTNLNAATFGFEPAVGACNQGERVFVNDNTGLPTDRTIVFPSLYAALNHADVLNYTYPYIYIDNDYLTVNETITVPNLTANNYFLAAETSTNSWTLTGALTLGGTNDYTLNLGSNAIINGNLTIDVTLTDGQIVLNDYDLTVGGTISNGDANRYVETNGTGSLIKKNPISMTQYNFPVYNNGFFAPAYATLQETGFVGTEGALLKVRANNGTEPQTLKNEGELGYAVNGLWTVDFNKGTSTLTNTNASLIFKFITGLSPAGMQQASFDITNSYIAVWNPALTEPPIPATAKWNSYKSVSSQNGSDGTQVTGVNLIDNVTNNKLDYAIFSGQTSFALNDQPAQAKNIIWTNATDTKIKFRWSRNSTTAENWAIVAKEGSMILNSAVDINPWNIAGDNFVDGYGYTGESFYETAGVLSGGKFEYTDANFSTSSTHPSGSANVKVIASGSYAPGQSLGEIEVEGLDQGKYYEFFVANYNGVGTGVDGTANFNQTFETLNPRNRKTLPAVYMGLDFSAAFKAANTNNYTLTDAATNTASGDVLTNYWYTGTICNTTSNWTNATTLRFKNYGKNTTGWNIKYSENNFTVNTSTFFTEHTVTRNITGTGNMNYYLVNATDGDGKVAVLYDNNKDIQIIAHQTPAATIASSVVGTTCETNNVTVTVNPTSTPLLTLNKWQYNIGAGWVDLVADGSVAGFGDFTGTNTLALTIDPVYNATVLQVRAILNDLTVCDVTTNSYTTGTVSIPVYQLDPLTATQDPATVTPVVCDGTGSVVFTTDITGLPVSATVQNWEYSNDNWVTPVTINAGGDFAYNGDKTQLTVSNITLANNGWEFRVVYKNGDCAVVYTDDVTLTVLDQPSIATHPAVVGTACANSATNTITITATSTVDNWTNASWYSSADGYMTALTAGAGITITKTGVTSTLELTSIPLAWNGRTFKVVFENVGAITCATAMTNASAGITVYESPVIADVTDKLVCTGGTLPTITLGWTGTINNVTWFYGTTATGPWTALPAGLDAATITTSGAQNHIIDIANINFAGVGVNWDGRYIRAFGTNGSCDDEEVFMINVYKSPSITTQPESVTKCAGENASYTFASNFTDFPEETRSTISWEFYYGSNWHPIANLAAVTGTLATVTGATSNTLNINNVDIEINGIGIRAKIGNTTCGNATTDGLATLAVNAVPVPPMTINKPDIKARSFTASWNEVLTATDYDLVVAEDIDLNDVVYTATGIATVIPTITYVIPNNTFDEIYKGQTLYVGVRSHNDCGYGPYTVTTVTLLDPTATFAAADLDFGNQAINTCSAEKAITITYDDLEEDLVMNLPFDYKWSAVSGGPYSQTLIPSSALGLTLGATGGTATIYVQFCPTDCGVLDGDVVFNDQWLGNTVITGATLAMTGTGIASAPTTPVTNLYFTDDDANDFTFTFTEGDGNNHLVVVSEGPSAWTPADDISYATGADLDITVANEVVAGTWIVSTGGAAPLTVTGLNPNTVYYAYVYEYNECTGSVKYTTPAVNQVYRLNIPTIDSPVSSDTAFAMNVHLHDRAGNEIANDIVDPITVTLTPNSGTLDVTSVAIDDAATEVGEFNQTWNETDGTLNATITASTVTNGVLPFTSNEFVVRAVEPTAPARVILWVGTPTCTDFDIKWTNGDGSRRLILARKNALPENPTDYETYTGHLTFGSGSVVGTSTYTMGTVTGTTNLLNDMVLGTSGTYYFRVVEFNGAASGLENYLLESATFNPRSRSMACKDMNDYAGIEVSDFNLTSADANALVTFRSTYEQNIAGFEINRMDLANTNPSFENIGTYTFNKELEAIGNSTTGKAYSFVDKSSKLMVGKTYVYQVVAIGFDGSRFDVAEGDITINNNDAVAGAAMSVSDVTVNHTTINFDVAVASNSNVTISVYDINGNLLTTIADGKQLSAGITSFNHNLNAISSGTYVLVIDAGNVVATQRFQIVK